MRVKEARVLQDAVGLRWFFRASGWLMAVAMLSACGLPAERGPSAGPERRPSAAAVPSPRPDASEPVSPGGSVRAAPDGALRVQRGSSPQRVASVRMTEHARRLLRSGQYARALTELEKSLSLDGTNPYAHYYIALSHYRLRNFKASLDFLGAAEAVLVHNRQWFVQSLVLRGDNFRALGRFREAGAVYRRALALDPLNPSANRGLLWTRQRSRIQSW